MQLTGFVLTSKDKGMHTGMILIHLHKLFDTLDHKFRLEKMICLGFKTPVIKRFESYLSNIKLFVFVDDVYPEAGTSNCCVLQRLF